MDSDEDHPNLYSPPRNAHSPTSEVRPGPANTDEKWKMLFEQQNRNFRALIQAMKTPSANRSVHLPEFDPDKGAVDASAWLSTADMCMAENPLRGAPLMIALSKALKGEASAWLSQISYAGMTWNYFQDAFTARFDIHETPAATLINLLSSKPKDNECLANYAASKINLLMSRWKELDKEQIAIAAVTAHLSQVEPRVNRIAFTTDISTRSKLHQELKALAYLKRKAPSSSERENEASDVKRQKFVPAGNIVKCAHCGRIGHHVSFCRYTRDNSRKDNGFPGVLRADFPKTTPTSKPGSSNTTVTCYNCGAMGHYASRCPQPKKNTSGNQSAAASASNTAEHRVDVCVVNAPTGMLQHADVDAEAGLASTHEVDCVPLLPLGDSVCNLLPKEQSTRPHLKVSSVKTNIWRADSTRRTSDATEVYQCQRKYDTLSTPRPRFNTVNDFFTDEIRRLRERLDTRLHEAVVDQDIVTTERLLAAGVSPAALDHSGLTPLHLCILHKLIKPFEVLLKYEGSANVRDARGLSVLHVAVLHRWLPGVDAALAAGADATALCEASKTLLPHTFSLERYHHVSYQDFVLAFVQTPIQLATKVGDLTMLVKLLNVAEKIGAVNCYNKKGQTTLYTAIMNGNLEAVDILLKKGATVDEVSKRRETALHIAVRKPIILKYLLDNTNCPSLFSDYGYAPIHKAAFCNQPESVKLLLSRFNNIELKTVAVNTVKEDKSGGMTALHLAAKYFSNETAEVLLEMGANPNEVDDLGNTPLHVAAKTINRAMSELLLRNGAVLSAKDHDGNSSLQIIATKFHDALSFFELVFDEFVCTKGLYPMGTTVVCVNYEVLSRNDDSRQIKAIEEFVTYGLRKILLHPFIESLLYLKWRQLLPVFYFLIMIYALFLVSFNIFVVNVFYCKDNILDISNIIDIPSNWTKTSVELPWFEMYDKWYYLLLALIYISICLLVLQESFYIYLKRLRYCESLESWVKLVGLILAACLPLTVHNVEMKAWQRHVACAALLLVWLQAMFLLSRFPGWGYYVLMFGKVAINMFKVFITSICLVVGFAFCFMIQFQSEPPFDGPISAIVKTLIMMSSEFDYEDLFGKEHDKQLQHSRTIVRLLFLVFVIFVAIVLVNFMIAVAVSDTNNLNIAGNISRLEKQVDLLSSLDVLVNCGPLSKMFKKKYGGKRYHKKMYNSIKANRTWFVECSSSVEMYPQVLPSALYRAIIDIARKKDERVMKSNFKNSSKTKIDALHDAFIGSDQNDQVKGRSPQSLRDIILKQNEKINQLSFDIANIKDMLEDLIASQVLGEKN